MNSDMKNAASHSGNSDSLRQAALSTARRFLIIVSLLGIIIFSLGLAVTFASQETVERSAQSFIQHQISKEMQSIGNEASSSSYVEQLKEFERIFEDESAQVKKYLANNLDQKIADAIAALCSLDCDKRENIRQSIRSGLEARLERVGVSLDTVQSFIQGRYTAILEQLRYDLRIFLMTNIVMFACVAFAMLIKRRACIQLFVPAGLLTVSTVLSICLYVFGQNWFYTLLYEDFWGYTYSVYAGLIFLSLLDVVINRARVTSFIINAITSVLGSALSVVPC